MYLGIDVGENLHRFLVPLQLLEGLVLLPREQRLTLDGRRVASRRVESILLDGRDTRVSGTSIRVIWTVTILAAIPE